MGGSRSGAFAGGGVGRFNACLRPATAQGNAGAFDVAPGQPRHQQHGSDLNQQQQVIGQGAAGIYIARNHVSAGVAQVDDQIQAAETGNQHQADGGDEDHRCVGHVDREPQFAQADEYATAQQARDQPGLECKNQDGGAAQYTEQDGLLRLGFGRRPIQSQQHKGFQRRRHNQVQPQVLQAYEQSVDQSPRKEAAQPGQQLPGQQRAVKQQCQCGQRSDGREDQARLQGQGDQAEQQRYVKLDADDPRRVVERERVGARPPGLEQQQVGQDLTRRPVTAERQVVQVDAKALKQQLQALETDEHQQHEQV